VQLTRPLAEGARLYLVMDLGELRRQARSFFLLYHMGVFVLLLVTTLGLRMALQRFIVRPITTLAGAVEQVRTRGEYRHRVPAAGSDEVARLGQGFNAMLAAIQERAREMRELTGFQRAILDNVAYGIISATPDGMTTSFNPAAERLLGYTSEEVVGRMNTVRWHDPEELAVRARQLSAELGVPIAPGFEVFTARPSRGLAEESEWTYFRKDGRRVPVLLSVTALRGETGQITGFVGLAYDATERRRLEAILLQSQKMEAVGQLAGGVAHDFNNILTVIMGFGNIAKLGMQPDDPHGPLIDQILTAAGRAADLTHGLLAFSRKQVILSKPVDLNLIVQNVEKLLRRLIGEDIELVVRLTADALTVMADGGQVEQVLMNLSTNARDAMPQGGTLLITTEVRRLGDDLALEHGLERPGDYALITVSDTGVGMDETTLGRMFEPFFTTKELGRGTGLGLSIAYGIIKQHEGTIIAYSEMGKGTTFKIYLPLLAQVAEVGQPEPDTPPPGGDETVLLAEDDPEVRELSGRVLRTAGYRLIEAVDGADALEKYQLHQDEIDLLILDMIMPRMSGMEVHDQVKRQHPGAKILFVSGYTADFIQKRGIGEPGINFISKPMSPRELLRKAREILDA
jgi:PAS domain S-box-containing protein